MSIRATIQRHITDYERTLSHVEQAFQAEIAKSFTAQNAALIDFLYKERAVYTFALRLLDTLEQDAIAHAPAVERVRPHDTSEGP